MKLRFSWLNSRKSLISSSLFDFALFSFLFFFIFKNSISNLSILIILNLLNSFVWNISSYIIGRYSNFEGKKIQIILSQYFKTFLNASINILITQVFFRLFWNWNYMNFESFSNFLNDFLSFYIFLLLLSGISQSIINLYLSNKYSNNSIWLFLGTAERARYFKNIIGSNTNFKFKNINPDYLINKEINAKGIVIDDEEVLKKKNIQFLFDLNNKGMKFMKVSNWCERYLNRYPLELVKVSEMIEGNFSYKKYSFKARIKRIVESLLSLIILIPALPIMVLAGLLIKIEDGGPIFYSQIRNGFEGKQFKIIKLRTMIINAEEKGEQWADKSDKRITKSGSVLRKLRIDELPQLLLVLSGEMSLIGPRPERPKIDILLREHIPNYDLRYAVKPGISGWAQVNYPYGASIEDSKQKLSYDIYYIKNFSILLDFMIFFKTLKLIINGKGSIPQRKKKNSLY